MEPFASATGHDQAPLVLEYRQPDLVVEKPILSVLARVFHFITAILLPVACFLLAAEHYPAGPDYQRGMWSDYLGFIPTARVGWPFYPLLLFSMFAAATMIFQPGKAIDRWYVRVGLFTGVVLAFQYAFIQIACTCSTDDWKLGSLASFAIPILFVVGLLFGNWLGYFFIWNRSWFRNSRLVFWLGVSVPLVLILLLYRPARSLVGIAIVGPVILAPGLTMTTFASLSIVALRRGNRLVQPLWVILSWTVGWLLAFSGAWTKSYLEAAKAYAALPPTNSNCYIATAAAQGHPRIVGSWQHGTTRMNMQLALFKAGEIALKREFPYAHQRARLIYDAVGRRLAERIRNPFIADIAYLGLKPIEWITAGVLAIFR